MSLISYLCCTFSKSISQQLKHIKKLISGVGSQFSYTVNKRHTDTQLTWLLVFALYLHCISKSHYIWLSLYYLYRVIFFVAGNTLSDPTALSRLLLCLNIRPLIQNWISHSVTLSCIRLVPLTPVVMGQANYAAITPPHSIINAMEYPNPKNLAAHLQKLKDNETEYGHTRNCTMMLIYPLLWFCRNICYYLQLSDFLTCWLHLFGGA